jgi:hypothetical protein
MVDQSSNFQADFTFLNDCGYHLTSLPKSKEVVRTENIFDKRLIGDWALDSSFNAPDSLSDIKISRDTITFNSQKIPYLLNERLLKTKDSTKIVFERVGLSENRLVLQIPGKNSFYYFHKK